MLTDEMKDLCKDPSDIATVLHTKFPETVMVLSIAGQAMPPYILTRPSS